MADNKTARRRERGCDLVGNEKTTAEGGQSVSATKGMLEIREEE